jgi:hypothetical protein
MGSLAIILVTGGTSAFVGYCKGVMIKAVGLTQATAVAASVLEEKALLKFDDASLSTTNNPHSVTVADDFVQRYNGSASYTVTDGNWDGTTPAPGNGKYKQIAVTVNYRYGQVSIISIKRKP